MSSPKRTERLKVYEVEDGVTSWVCARHPADAIDMLAESIGVSREEYLRDQEPEDREMAAHETIRIRVDYLSDAARDEMIEGLPEGSRAALSAGEGGDDVE